MRTDRQPRKQDQLFVRDGRRSYRRRYSLAEVRWGLGILAALGLVAAWVAWKGAHPDPALFEAAPELPRTGALAADRGPLPARLAAAGWHEGPLSRFDARNLYVKIDGREDYYKSFGFEQLYFVSLILDEDPTAVVDVEFFDLGQAPNALGAYAGERPPEIKPAVGDRGMSHLARNALFMTRGRYYIRAIGSEESPRVLSQLSHLEEVFGSGVQGEPLPWAYALFVGQLGLDPSHVSYMKENAFSFGFARNVYAALLGDGETEVFVVAAASDDDAARLAARFTAGFLAYGRAAGESAGVSWVEDRYLGSLSGVMARATWVTGVRRAADIRRAEDALSALREAIQALPDAVVRQAGAAAAAASPAASGAEKRESEPVY